MVEAASPPRTSIDQTESIGKCFWPLPAQEARHRKARGRRIEESARLATRLHSHNGRRGVKLVDAAYWVKGFPLSAVWVCGILLLVDGNEEDYCLVDLKEAVKASAPHATRAKMPSDQAERVVEGARHLSPYLGDRMLAAKLDGNSVFVRELMPQDRKIEVEQLTSEDAIAVAGFLAAVVGRAHGRQMDSGTRKEWQRELQRSRSKSLNAPSWLWTNLIELLADHERGYLDHCRQWALEDE